MASHIPVAKTSIGGKLSREASSVSLKGGTKGGGDEGAFQLGDTVWVAGTKKGIIRFIGTTSFAPGEWAGIELDEPKGKNDGSVGGEKYFTCPENHGVFSRLNRLSRKQSVIMAETQSSSIRRMSKVAGPAGLDPSDIPSSSTTVSPAESTSSLSGGVGPPQVGDRVIVASALSGTKTGTLRYLGFPKFAKGEWAGIELDAAIGKNDGSVDGERYFECAPNFGLFAPIHKVTKSPKMKMMKPSSLTPGKLRRESSTLSDRSTAGSVNIAFGSSTTPIKQAGLVTPATVKSSTSALKDTLREKDQYIEQLLRERELERMEVAKAAGQTDQVEYKLMEVKQQLETSEAKVSSHAEECAKVKLLLDEERKKVEDLQFRLEEEQIVGGDKSTIKPSDEVNDLRSKLKSVESECETLRGDNMKVLEKLKEVESLGVKESQDLENLQKENKKLMEDSTALKELRDKFQILSREFAQEQKRSENLEVEANKVFEAEEQLMFLNDELSRTKRRAETAETALEAEKKRMQDTVENAKTADFKSSETIVQLETDLKSKENEIEELTHKLKTFSSKSEDLESKYSDNSKELAQKLKEIQELKNNLDKSVTENKNKTSELEHEIDNIRKENQELLATKDNLELDIKSKDNELKAKQKEVDSLKSNLNTSGSSFQSQVEEKISEIASLSTKLESSESQLESIMTEYNQAKSKLTELEETLDRTRVNLETASEQRKAAEKEVGTVKDNMSKMDEEMRRLTDAIAKRDEDLESVYAAKKKLETANESLLEQVQKSKEELTKTMTEKSSSFEVEKTAMNKMIKDGEEELKKVTKKLETETKTYEGTIKSMKQDFESEQRIFETKISSKEAKITELEEKINILKTDSASVSESKESQVANLKIEIKDLEKALKESEENFTALNNDLKEKDSNLTEKIEMLEKATAEKEALQDELKRLKAFEPEVKKLKDVVKELEESKQSLVNQLESVKDESSDASTHLESMTAANADLNNKLTDVRQSLSREKDKVSDLENILNKKKIEYESLKDENSREITKLADKCELLSQELSESQSANEKELTKLKNKIEALNKEKERIAKENDSKSEHLNEEIESLRIKLDQANDEVAVKSEKLSNTEWKRKDLETQLERLKHTHDTEMGELVDVVNDLKIKEDELSVVHKEIQNQNKTIDDLCGKLLNQEKVHKEAMVRKEEELAKRLENSELKLNEAKEQAKFLKEQMGNIKVENDLIIEKLKVEHEGKMKLLNAEIDKKISDLNKTKDDLIAKEQELEYTKEKLQDTKEELEELSADLDIKEASFSNENREITERHQEEIEELVVKNENLNKKIGELNEKIACQTSEYVGKMDKLIETKKEEVNKLKEDISDKETIILDLEMTVKNLNSDIESLEGSMKSEVDHANSKIDKLQSENENLRRSKHELETSVKNLSSERDHIVNLNEDLSLKIVEFEVSVKEMNSQMQSLQVQYQKQKVELSEKQEIMNQGASSLADIEQSLSTERARADTLQISVNDLESERDTLKEKLEKLYHEVSDLRSVHEKNQNLELEVADLTKKNEFLFEEIARDKLRLETRIQTLLERLENQSKDASSLTRELESLKHENVELASYKRQVLMLEQEKKDLETQVVTLTVESRMATIRQRSPSPSPAGDENLKGQIDFLNSVIVDMQKKNDKLKSKIDLLENAGILDDTAEFFFNGVSSRQSAPRLYCDICDQFDIHDTEDCPKQAGVVEEEETNTKHKGKRNAAPRPYCETCEVFGHETEDCKEPDTF